MRTFRITGLFGMQFTLSTYAPGNVSIKYPTRTRTEPVISQEASTSTNNRLYNSELTFNIPAEASGTPFPGATPSTTARRPASSPPSRTPSLAATEIVPFELTQAEIVTDIQTQGIKVRDFAYEPQSIPPLPEFWDAPKALGEYDFRLAEEPRRVAINGKTLRRLLDVGWVTIEDAKRRWHRIDWAALAKHDSRPAYPWRWRRDKKPSGERRLAMLKERTGFLRAYDQAHRELELQRQRELARGPVRIVVADADADMEGKGKRVVGAVRRYRQNQAQPDKKREMEEETTPRHVRTSTTHDSKRRRLSASPSPEARSSPSARRPLRSPTATPTPTPTPSPPLSSAYDPHISPLVAAAAEHMNVGNAAPTPTPPGSTSVTPCGSLLEHGKGQGKSLRTLGRTETFRIL